MGGPFEAPDIAFGGVLMHAFGTAALFEALCLPFWFHLVARKLGGAGSLYESFRIIAFFDAAIFVPAFLGLLGRLGFFEIGGFIWWVAFSLAIVTWWNTYKVIADSHQISRLRAFAAHTIAVATVMLAWMALRSLVT
jgi:hypothetical protein